MDKSQENCGQKATWSSTWTIVNFLEESAVEAVPTSWIIGDSCYFPASTTEKTRVAISNNEPLSLEWPTHKIRTFRNGTYDNYSLARQKARLAEETSDLNSDIETQTKKRKIIRKIVSDLESDSEKETFACNKSKSKIPPPPKLKLQESLSQSTPLSQPAVVNFQDTPNRRRTFSEISLGNSSHSTPVSIKKSRLIDSETRILRRHNVIEDESQTVECTNSCKRCCIQFANVCDKSIKNVTTQCHLIRNIVTDVLNEVKDLKNNSYRAGGGDVPVEIPPTFFERVNLNFPLDNLEDLNSFEEFLNNQDNFEMAAKEIARFGGNTSYEFIKRAMTPIISNRLAEKFNWEGKKKKKKFSELSLAKLIIDADKRAKTSSTQKECEKSIVSWLKRAKERQERVAKNF